MVYLVFCLTFKTVARVETIRMQEGENVFSNLEEVTDAKK